jgi:hypothetical protein
MREEEEGYILAQELRISEEEEGGILAQTLR